MRPSASKLLFTALIVLGCLPGISNAFGDDGDARPATSLPGATADAGDKAETQLSDLTLGNIFSQGWDEKFAERPGDESVLRCCLVRTEEGFLERELRTTFSYAHDTGAVAGDNYEIQPQISYALNRRFMVEFDPQYDWTRFKNGNSQHVSSWEGRAYIEVIDTADTAVSLQFGVIGAPQADDSQQTQLTFALAGFRDLGNRVGLQWSIGNDVLVGPAAIADDPRNFLNFAVAATKTVSDDKALLKNLTFILETYAETALDGSKDAATQLSLLPGVRWEAGRGWSIAGSLEVPVTRQREADETWYFYIFKELD